MREKTGADLQDNRNALSALEKEMERYFENFRARVQSEIERLSLIQAEMTESPAEEKKDVELPNGYYHPKMNEETRNIVQLHREGWSREELARRFNREVEEINLIIDAFREAKSPVDDAKDVGTNAEIAELKQMVASLSARIEKIEGGEN